VHGAAVYPQRGCWHASLVTVLPSAPVDARMNIYHIDVSSFFWDY
jgi:hypothetical protein